MYFLSVQAIHKPTHLGRHGGRAALLGDIDEHKAAVSKAKTGRTLTDEHRAAISKARRG